MANPWGARRAALDWLRRTPLRSGCFATLAMTQGVLSVDVNIIELQILRDFWCVYRYIILAINKKSCIFGAQLLNDMHNSTGKKT
jgi:hypothetical protein